MIASRALIALCVLCMIFEIVADHEGIRVHLNQWRELEKLECSKSNTNAKCSADTSLSESSTFSIYVQFYWGTAISMFMCHLSDTVDLRSPCWFIILSKRESQYLSCCQTILCILDRIQSALYVSPYRYRLCSAKCCLTIIVFQLTFPKSINLGRMIFHSTVKSQKLCNDFHHKYTCKAVHW